MLRNGAHNRLFLDRGASARQTRRSRVEHVALPRASVTGLVACAWSRALFPELDFVDPDAEHIVQGLSLPGNDFPEPVLLGAAVRATAVDWLARAFFEQQREARGVSYYSGLSTRGLRLHSLADWTDIELPSVAHLKRALWPAKARFSIVGRSPGDPDPLGASRGRLPVFAVLDEAWAACAPQDLDHALDVLGRNLPPGSEVVIIHEVADAIGAYTTESGYRLVQRNAARYPTLQHIERRDEADCAQHLLALGDHLGDLGAPRVEHLRVV
jgi:hypothetical protein